MNWIKILLAGIVMASSPNVFAETMVINATANTTLLRGEGQFKTLFAKRTVEVDGTNYEVEYEYQPMYATIPATFPAGQPHYTAVIQVRKVEGDTMTNVGKSFGGQYTQDGCFEDDPATLVKEALENEKHEN